MKGILFYACGTFLLDYNEWMLGSDLFFGGHCSILFLYVMIFSILLQQTDGCLFIFFFIL